MPFQGDKTLRGAGEVVKYTKQQIEEIIKCSEDVIYFSEHYFYIMTLSKGRMLIPLWDFQKKILKAFIKPPDNKQNILLMQSRQTGKTTVSTIFLLWKVLFCKDFRIAILANKEALATEILARIKMSYSLLPNFLKVGVTEWNEKSIAFENYSSIIASSTNSSALRGLSINLLVLDELAWVPKNIQQTMASSVIPALCSDENSMIIAMSTPNGTEMFYNLYQDAIRNENNYYAIRVLWSSVPGRSSEWKKNVIQSLPGKELQFAQEYDLKFFGASDTLVDNDALEKIRTIAPIEIKWGGLLQIYEVPIKGKKYIIGVDPAGGTGKNYSVIQVLKVNKMRSIEQVAIFRSNTHSPYDLCQYVMDISEYYNDCLCLIENNSDIGGILCSQLFYTHEFDKLIFVDNKIGVRSSKQKKAEANYLLKRYIEQAWLKINDRTTLFELSLYKEQSIGLFAADNNCNDDTVTSLMWSIFALHLPNISSDFFDENGEAIEDYSNGSGSDGMVALFD